LLQDLLSKFSSPAEKQGYLLQLTAAHPYFAPAQFCLLQTLQPGETAHNHRAAIAHLLYNNAHWLQFQLAQSTSPPIAAAPSPAIEDLALVDTVIETDTVASEIAPAADGDNKGLAVAPLTEEMAQGAETLHIEVENREVAAEATAAPILNNRDNGATETPASDTAAPTETVPADAPIAAATPPVKEEMLFEPLYAVDYFASQGIKLTEEVQPSDKLGQQLRSFTEWLKSMKKTHNPGLPANDLAAEEDVQTIAEKSNTEDDVVTEAMAEVFALQGRKQKAIAIYGKLSLLNPHKSAYFAAKIENLK
jgi:hypothetical protein